MTQTALVTAEQLFEMCEDERYELAGGVLVPLSPPPGFRHGEIAATIAIVLGAQRSIEAHRNNSSSQILKADDQLSGADVLPGFQVRVADPFAIPEDM
jgi:hypothetical protein